MKAIKYIWIFAFSFALLSCNTANSKDKDTQEIIVDITPEQLHKVQTEVQILDVRTPGEYKNGHIAGAKNSNVFDADFVSKIEANYKKDSPIYIYCKSGGRSMKASKMLKEAGYTKIYNMDGGYLAWKDKKYQIEK